MKLPGGSNKISVLNSFFQIFFAFQKPQKHAKRHLMAKIRKKSPFYVWPYLIECPRKRKLITICKYIKNIQMTSKL